MVQEKDVQKMTESLVMQKWCFVLFRFFPHLFLLLLLLCYYRRGGVLEQFHYCKAIIIIGIMYSLFTHDCFCYKDTSLAST